MSKYKTILQSNKDELHSLYEIANQDSWKPIYHIHPPFGLMNDPNGVSYYNDEYHVFYQWYPFGPIHGMKHWGHVKAQDLINWERMPVAIIPTESYESHGAYSGSAIVKDDLLHLLYTGNIKNPDDSRDAKQCMATMDSQYTMTKYSNNPVIDIIPDGYTKHVRDPKVWKHNDIYYMLLGAQRKNKTGTLLLYKSKDLYNWNFQGEITTNLKEFGFMWECPDYFQLSGKDVLLFSPQGIEKDRENFHNIYNVVYAIGHFDIKNLYFHIDSYYEADKGFDFYAPQTLEDSTSRRLLFAWAGSSEITYPSDDYMWAHCLTLPRELTLEDNILKQKPVSELTKLRTTKKEISGDITAGLNVLSTLDNEGSYELIVTLKTEDAKRFGLSLFHNEEECFPITFNRKEGTVSIDRSNFCHQFGGEYGYERYKKINIQDTIELQIFVDTSIVEIFLCDGSTVFTSRVFPRKDLKHHIAIFSDAKLNFIITQHKLKRGIV